ncbi:autotransporter outer membrane beta-barrel domain-containing protein [Bordetella genomosp. 12]|uniref:Autotransporter domain-containing protein n=1 Tax=Bordetella genomosp. 12 TaxID=463035 RepID=A0A261VC39_9BORD|nr:autotransporter outer membrane beta-barrel domain-containing protein [Bordetella genomosp. 12]OZI70713.1 hypothetical protein CAL22_12380 [Bordetella genomosp. 12]
MVQRRYVRQGAYLLAMTALGQAPAWAAPSTGGTQASAAAAAASQIQAHVLQRTNQAVAMVQAAGILLLDAQMGYLQQRMWELRDGGEGGLWTRGGITSYHASTSDAPAFRERLKYGSIGGDYGWDLGKGHLFLGVYGGTGWGKVHDSEGGDGKIRNYYIGSYLTYFEPEGWYVDFATRAGRIKLDMEIDVPQLNRSYDASDKHNVFTGSLETGYHFALGKGWFVEPQAQILYEYSGQNSVIGRVGARVGRDITLAGGSNLRPYVGMSYLAQLSNDDTVGYNGKTYSATLPGDRWRIGGGLALDSGPHRAFVDLRYGHGPDISHEVTAVVGYSYRF